MHFSRVFGVKLIVSHVFEVCKFLEAIHFIVIPTILSTTVLNDRLISDFTVSLHSSL